MGGNGEACDTGMADNRDVVHVDGEDTVYRAGGKLAVAVAAVVDTEGTEDEGQEVWVEEALSGVVDCLSQALTLGDIADRHLAILGAS